MKYCFMQQHAKEFKVERMSKVLGVSRSGYYKFLKAKPSARERANQELLSKIKKIHKESRSTYGSPRIHAKLLANGDKCSRKKIGHLMKKNSIKAKMNKKCKVTTKSDPKAKVAPNLLQQDFTASAPNQRWAADISYISTAEGWLYLAAIIDLFSRRIVGLAMDKFINTNLISIALNQALIHRNPADNLLHHSDKGCQYTSVFFQDLLKKNNIICSMSGTGNCYDNAVMESFFHTLKTEHVYFENYGTREQAKRSIFEYIEVFYNRKRSHSTLGYLSPFEFEKQWEQQQNFSFRCVH